MEIKEIRSENAPSPIGPYSQAVEAGNLIFISGILPLDLKTGTIISDIPKACEFIFKHLDNILLKAGSNKNNIVKTSIFLKNMDNFAEINKSYANYFSGITTFPARSTLEVSKLPKDAVVEMDFIAFKN